MYTTDEAEVNRAIADAALAQAAHGWDGYEVPDAPAEVETWGPEPDDAEWAAETSPLNQPLSYDNGRWSTVLDLDADAAGRIYRTMPDFAEWDIHALVAWFYAIDFELRERLS